MTMAKYNLMIRATIHAKSDADAEVLQKKVDALLTKHARTLLAVEGVVLDKISVHPKVVREGT
jgi:hypothetical protein